MLVRPAAFGSSRWVSAYGFTSGYVADRRFGSRFLVEIRVTHDTRTVASGPHVPQRQPRSTRRTP